jgi:L-ascorbate metabolism protein UlaG (beta-lactamase superfamily)
VETASLLPEDIRIEKGQIGGYIRTDFGGVKFLPAFHGSGVAGGLACGFLLEIEGKKIYFAGDTGLTVEMSLLAEDEIDVALLPIGDRFTMGPKDAVRAVSMIRPKKVIPMHYNTMPAIEQDPERFKEMTERDTGTECIILAVGESLSL